MAFCAPVLLQARRSADPRMRSGVNTRRTRCTASVGGEHDLVVVGAGALGLRAARLWRARHPDAEIVCATRTEARHADLTAAGFTPALAEKLSDKCARVLFCAPPSGATAGQYAELVGEAGSLSQTRFVFTSATSTFKDVPHVTEDGAPNDGARARRLLDAEDAALGASDGTVLRLGGLYDLRRGPHVVWLRNGECTGGADGMLNMVHYDDAAEAAVAALDADADVADGRRFVAVDGAPLTRGELCEAARRHPVYAGFDMPTFGKGGHVKRIDCTWTRQMLKWEPKWTSFADFINAEAKEHAESAPAARSV